MLDRRSRRSSIAGSICSILEADDNVKPTEQEEEAQADVTPYELEFWKPKNILTVTDTPFSKKFLVHLLVIAFSVPGNLARISLQSLTRYQNSYVNYSGGTVVWVNFAACFIMAWTNHSHKFWNLILRDSKKTSMKQVALHTGITSGFCGSFSTFSSMMIEIFFKTVDIVTNDTLPNPGYRVMEFFASSLVSVGVPLFGHIVGAHFAILFDFLMVPKLNRFLHHSVVRVIELACVFIGFAALVANLVLTCALPIEHWYKQSYSFCVLMGAFGALMRFHLSVYNGKFIRGWFPLGTLLANIIGVLLIAICYLLELGYKSESIQLIVNPTKQMVVKGFSTGWAGSLTTVSSLINELYNMEYPLYQHIYFWTTFIPSLVIIILIDGCYFWTRGMALP